MLAVILFACGGTSTPPEPLPEPAVQPEPEPATWESDALKSLCNDPAGAVLIAACAGGGRDLVEGYFDRAPAPMDQGPLREALPTLPPARWRADSVAQVDIAVRQVLDAAPHACADSARCVDLTDVVIADGAYGSIAQEKISARNGLHYNYSNGVLGMLISRGQVARYEGARAQSEKDFGSDAATADASSASALGGNLGEIAIGVQSATPKGLLHAEALMLGKAVPEGL